MMKEFLLVIAMALSLGLVISCQKQDMNTIEEPRPRVEADVAAIKAVLAEFVRLYNAEDFQGLISAFYTEDAILMTPNALPRRTQADKLLSYQTWSESNIEHIDTSVAEEVRVSGDIAVAWGMDTGTTTPRSGGEPVRYGLKWLMTFERQPDGAWKCLYEMWNNNDPAADLP
jgi:ketosteroid isomerase-like protein